MLQKDNVTKAARIGRGNRAKGGAAEGGVCRDGYDEILNSFDFPYSNGFTEGCNDKTKVLKHVCFGLRNFKNFRNRILFGSTCA